MSIRFAVEEAWNPARSQSGFDVAAVSAPKLVVNVNASPAPVASVPQERTPALFAFTSQDAAFRFETMSCVVEARPETDRFVVVAFVVVVLVKMLFPVQVLLA
jgi:hypothetical protein